LRFQFLTSFLAANKNVGLPRKLALEMLDGIVEVIMFESKTSAAVLKNANMRHIRYKCIA
jgi:hypothetical protein